MFENILRTFMAETLKQIKNIQPSAVLSPTDARVYANLGRLDHQFFSANLQKKLYERKKVPASMVSNHSILQSTSFSYLILLLPATLEKCNKITLAPSPSTYPSPHLNSCIGR